MSDPAYLAYRGTQSFASLDGLRCLSILAVIWHHAGFSIAGVPLLERGFLGVDLFFVISGFLIATLLLREEQTTGRIGIRAFYIRRSLRIFPLYFGLLLIVGCLLILLAPRTGFRILFFTYLPYNATYTSNWIQQFGPFGITWSLSTEEQFYLVWPWLQKYLHGFAMLVAIGVLLAVNQLMNFRILDAPFRATFGIGWEELNVLQVTFTPILLGVLLANVLQRPGSFRILWKLTGAKYASAVWLGALLLLAQSTRGDLAGWPRLGIHLLMSLLVAACVIREDHGLAGCVQWRPLAFLGRISYGMYLFHLLGMAAIDLLLRRLSIELLGARFLLTLVVTVVLATLSYYLYESWFLRYRERFTPPRTR